MMKTVCAMVGSFGSGCSYIADKILVERHGLRKVSLSGILRDELRRETEIANPSRDELQRYGTELRQRHSPGYLAERAVDQVRQMADEARVVVDSVRNPGELAVLRREFTTFYSIGVYASQETRWERVREQYSGNHDDFIRDDKTDKDICFRGCTRCLSAQSAVVWCTRIPSSILSNALALAATGRQSSASTERNGGSNSSTASRKGLRTAARSVTM